MLNTNNTYFENIKRLGNEYEAARVERKARKEQIIAAHGWDSEELKAWYAENNAAKFPLPAEHLQSLPRLGAEPFPQGG